MQPVSQGSLGLGQIQSEADQHGLAGDHRSQDDAKEGPTSGRVGVVGISRAFSQETASIAAKLLRWPLGRLRSRQRALTMCASGKNLGGVGDEVGFGHGGEPPILQSHRWRGVDG